MIKNNINKCLWQLGCLYEISLEWWTLDITWLWLQVSGGVPTGHAPHLPAFPALGPGLRLQLLRGVHWNLPRVPQGHQRRGYRYAWRRENRVTNITLTMTSSGHHLVFLGARGCGLLSASWRSERARPPGYPRTAPKLLDSVEISYVAFWNEKHALLIVSTPGRAKRRFKRVNSYDVRMNNVLQRKTF